MHSRTSTSTSTQNESTGRGSTCVRTITQPFVLPSFQSHLRHLRFYLFDSVAKSSIFQLVEEMSAATNASFREKTPARMSQRHKSFMFMLRLTTTHELCHVFTSYLIWNQNTTCFTPPGVAHLDFEKQRSLG